MPERSHYGDATSGVSRAPASEVIDGEEVDFSELNDSPSFLEETSNKHPASLDDDGDEILFPEEDEERDYDLIEE